MKLPPGLSALKHQPNFLLIPGLSGIHQRLVQHYKDPHLAASSFKFMLMRLLRKQGTCLTSRRSQS